MLDIVSSESDSSRKYSKPSVDEQLAQLEKHYNYAVEQLQNARRHNLELGAQIEDLTRQLDVGGGAVSRRGARRLRAVARAVLDLGVRVGRRAVYFAYRRLGD